MQGMLVNDRKSRSKTIWNTAKTGISFAIILICAILPRLLHSAAFLTLDEYLWLDRSRNFLLALRRHNWGETLQTGHPAVTTMWSGTLGLWLYGLHHGLIQSGDFVSFLQGLSWDHQHPELFTYLHLPTALITALGIVGIAYLLTRLFGRRVGVIAGLLLALDPWYLAYSRVLHHDALMTTFMTLSALALLLYVWRETGRWALLLSGLCAGLALLSKALSLFIFPWAALMLLVALGLREWPFSRALGDGAIWTLATWMAFFIPWPAMWLHPAKTLWRMRQMVTTHAINPHPKGQFFLGQPVANPGALYYPLLALFAMTPLVMLGLGALFATWRKRRLTVKGSAWLVNPDWLLVVYVVAFAVFISLGEKKQRRYLLASLVMMNVVAAIGLSTLIAPLRSLLDRALTKWRKVREVAMGNVAFGFITIALVGAQGLFCLPHHPHYSTYYNPLIGGNRAASRMLLIGWGEGNAQAAEYLNQRPDPHRITAVASMATSFAPYFEGRSWLWWPRAKMFGADYVVLHRRDTQRGQPDPTLVRYIQETWPLEQTITLHGLPYVFIYQAPATDWTLPVGEDDSTIGRQGLLAYRVRPRRVTAGQRITVTLYLQQTRDAGRRFVRLQNDQGTWEARRFTKSDDLSDIESRTVFEEVHYVDLPADVEPGTFQIELGVQREAETAIRWLTLPESPAVRVLSHEGNENN